MALIGAITLDPVRVLGVVHERGCSPDWFFDNRCRSVAEIIWKMSSLGNSIGIDILTLSNECKNAGIVIDSTFLEHCIDSCPTATNAEYYLSEVEKLYKKRNGILLCDGAKDSFLSDEHPDSVTSTLVSRLMDVTKIASNDSEEIFRKDKELREKAKATGFIGLPSRFRDLQNVKGGYSFDEGECVVISGRTSHGKTLLMTDETVHWAMDLGIPVGLCELDMSERMWRRRTAAAIADVNSFRFDYGNATQEEHDNLDMGWKKLNSLPYYVTDRRLSIGEILAWGTMMHIRKGIKVLAIDHLTKIRPTRDDERMTERAMLGEWVTKIQDFGKRFGVLTIILSQSNTRDSDKYLGTTPEISGCGSLKESGAIEENADGVITINKKPGMSTTLYTKDQPLWDMVINIAKNRARGPTGLVPLFLYTWRQKFVDYKHGLLLQGEYEMRKGNRERE